MKWFSNLPRWAQIFVSLIPFTLTLIAIMVFIADGISFGTSVFLIISFILLGIIASWNAKLKKEQNEKAAQEARHQEWLTDPHRLGYPASYTHDYTVVDIETTGLDRNIDDIIEISAIKYRNDEQVSFFSYLCIPSAPLTDEIISITGISNETIQEKGLSIEKVILQFSEFIGDDVLVGHNIVNFDLKFLNRVLDEHCGRYFHNDYLDTLSLSRNVFPHMKNYKLKTLCEEFELPPPSHRGLDDCVATAALYKVIREADEKQISA